MRTLYFEWLMRMVGLRHEKRVDRPFLEFLHNIAFVDIIPNDENRGEDGIYLRYTFATRNNQPGADYYMPGPCSILEMLIALAVKLEFMVAEGPVDNTAKWFWMFIDNLRLTPHSGPSADIRNSEIIGRFLRREYEYNGEGGLFPLRHPREDQRELEIWYQMMAYAEENNI